MLFSPKIGKLWLVSGSEKGEGSEPSRDSAKTAEEETSKQTTDVLMSEINRLRDLYETCREGDDRPDRFAPLADIAEDLKTLADSLSFAEVAKVTDQLCSLIERLGPSQSGDIDLLGLHVQSLRLIAQLTRRAENPEGVAELTEELSRAVNRRLNKSWLMSV